MHIAQPTDDNVLVSPDMKLSYGEIHAALSMMNSEVRYDGPFDSIDVGQLLTLWVYEQEPLDESEIDETEPTHALQVKLTGALLLDPANFPDAVDDTERCIVFEAVVLRRTAPDDAESDGEDLVFGLLYGDSQEGRIIEDDPESDRTSRLIMATLAYEGLID